MCGFKRYLLIFSLIGCANLNVIPPQERSVEKSRIYRSDYEQIWVRAVDWFAEHNAIIDKIEKESGLLTTRFKIGVGQEYLDCGDIDISGVLGSGEINRFGNLNLTVRKFSTEQVKVSVNFFGEWSMQDNDLWDGRAVVAQGHCVSTGDLERNVLVFIGE